MIKAIEAIWENEMKWKKNFKNLLCTRVYFKKGKEVRRKVLKKL